MGLPELTDITVQLHHETDKAVLVSDDGNKMHAVWLPKSQIEIEDKGKGVLEITLPIWIAKEKGLI